MKLLFAAVALSCFLLVNLYPFYAANPNELYWGGPQFPMLDYALVCLLTFLGIVFGCVFKQVSQAKGAINIAVECRAVFSSGIFWSAVCVSPFLFAGTFAFLRKEPSDASAFMLAFQNGFFCERLIRDLSAHPIPNAPHEADGTVEE